ncbi:ABC transporter permease [Leekyejoonella antrihumi]|uniref:ABC transporter permease n=1 Tax=Leekyejoonella antrihumi TaxID=1660198 RepID=A0A563DV65_9MICO|nr:ABC transporter permease [Leekyejoonella antrihumi]TWP34059.1 ABC transporter permease [Leekyejoonella antrihumi]
MSDTLTETPKPTPRSTRGNGRQARSQFERVSLILAWIVVIAIFSFVRPDTFFTVGNMATILGSDAVLVILTLGLILPLRAGDYDLSIAGTLTLSAMLVGIMNGEHHINIWLVVLAALAVGVVVGLFNGLFVLIFGINPFIVTLGMGTFLAGIVLLISNDQTFAGISPGLVNVVVGDRFLGIPLEFYYGLIACILVWYLFDLTTFGRKMLFVGTARDVARLSGIKVGRTRLVALVGAGVLAALAGILYAGTSGSADPTSGTAQLLPAYAAAFLGATAIVPGRFNAWGTIIAVYFLATGVNGLAILGLGSWVQDVFYGGALIVAVALSQLARRRQEQEIT